jgi:hypothetical protein
MLIKNVWQTKGLYNGALGTVKGLLFRQGLKPPSQPYCVLVEFDDYSGPSAADGHRLVPIVPEIAQFDIRSGKSGSRRQVLLCWVGP